MGVIRVCVGVGEGGRESEELRVGESERGVWVWGLNFIPQPKPKVKYSRARSDKTGGKRISLIIAT